MNPSAEFTDRDVGKTVVWNPTTSLVDARNVTATLIKLRDHPTMNALIEVDAGDRQRTKMLKWVSTNRLKRGDE